MSLCSERVVLYNGIGNDYSINSNLPEDKLIFEVTNGTVRKWASNELKIHPTNIGKDSISIYGIVRIE